MSTPLNLSVFRNQTVNYILGSGRSQVIGRVPAGLVVTFGSPSTITGTVTDASGIYSFLTYDQGAAVEAVTITVNDPNPLAPPVISCASAVAQNGVQTVTVAAGSIAVQLAVTNSGSNWTGAFPSGLNINSYGLISGTLGPGTYNLTAQASNYAWSQNSYTNGPTQTALYPFTLVVIPALPVIALPSSFQGNFIVGDEGSSNYPFTVQDYAKPVTWSAANLPPGLALNPNTGFLSGKTTTVGNYAVVITATNSTGAGTYALQFSVSSIQQVPVVTSPDLVVSYGQPTSLSFAVGVAVQVHFDATNNPTSWTASSLPLGLTCDAVTGVVSGILRTAGSYRFYVKATNIIGDSLPFGVSITATGTVVVFQFVSDDPTLSDVQINQRSGAVVFGRATPFKTGERVRFALIWLDYGEAVTPPAAESVTIGIRVGGQYSADYVLLPLTAQLIAAADGQPAYLLAEFDMDGDDLQKELAAAVRAEALPLELMADVVWTSDGKKRKSQTFTFGVLPSVTY